MSTIRYRRIDGTESHLAATHLERFAAGIGGELLHATSAGYDDARRLWNAMIDRRPALIARCAGTADVMQALRFAREHEMDLSVRGGGHNIAGTALCEGGLVVDLSAMRAVRAEPVARRCWIQGGATWADVDRETQAFGQAVPSGIVTTTGVAGLTLGGGFGWVTRRFGLTCDHLEQVDLVTADGELLSVDAESTPELFWALHGGGGNFGVVTGFSFRTRPVGPTVLGGMVVHDFADAAEVARRFRAFTEQAPEDVGALLVLRRAPPAPFLPESVHGRLIAAIALCHTGSLERAERDLADLRGAGRPLADAVAAKPFRTHQAMLDAAQAPGRHYYWKSEFLSVVSDGAIATLVEHAGRIASPHSSVLLMQLGGAARHAAAADPATALREAGYVLNIAAAWEDPAQSDTHVAWAREFWRAMRPHAAGTVYMNFLTGDEYAGRLPEAYRADVADRLARVKRRYDPDNVFHHNANIVPASQASAA